MPAPRTLILGVDPGTTGMGYAVLDASVEPPVVESSGLVDAARAERPAEKLLAIANCIDDVIAAFAPAAMAIERLYFNRNVRTAMAVAEARGVVLLCAARAGLAVAEYTPQEVKLAVTGSGGADKKQVQRMLDLVVARGAPVAAGDNVADAIAIALTHAARARFTAAVAKAP